MARRYGGKYSPETDGETETAAGPARAQYDGARVDPAGARANTMFIPAVVLLFTSLGGGALTLSLGLAGAGCLTLGAWLLREGLRAKAAYDARKVAHRPAFPRMIAAGLLAGIGVAFAAYRNDPGLIAPLLFGGAATGLHLLAFGIDPLKSKGMEGIDSFQQSRVARVVDEAEKYLGAMSDAVRRAGDPKVEARVERFQATARDLIRTVEEDPRDLTAARKFLTVYLLGARDATVKFADIYARSRDATARADYLALLDDLEQNFSARTRKMLLEDRSDLTIEIDVLRERLQREGVRLD